MGCVWFENANSTLEYVTGWVGFGVFVSQRGCAIRTTYGYLLDYPDQDTVQPRIGNGVETGRSHDVFTPRYQRERQRVYDRVQHLVHSAGYGHVDVEDAKAEAGLVRAQAHVSRARGDQLGWVKHMLRGGSSARFGYRNPAEMVASRLDVRRSTTRDLVYLAERLGDDRIESIRQGAVSYERVLGETRLAEAGASAQVIERSRDMDLESVKRVLQAHRKMSRQDEREVFDSQYLTLQPSLDGSHVQARTARGFGGGDMPPGSRPKRRAVGTCW